MCVDGGLEVDGSLIKDVRPEEIEEQCDLLIEKSIKCVVVNGIFSPIDRQYFQEERVAKIIKRRIPDAFVVMSKDGRSFCFLSLPVFYFVCSNGLLLECISVSTMSWS